VFLINENKRLICLRSKHIHIICTTYFKIIHVLNNKKCFHLINQCSKCKNLSITIVIELEKNGYKHGDLLVWPHITLTMEKVYNPTLYLTFSVVSEDKNCTRACHNCDYINNLCHFAFEPFSLLKDSSRENWTLRVIWLMHMTTRQWF